MARLLVAGLLLAAAAPLAAQSAPPVAPQAPRPLAQTMTRADVQARVQAQFVKRDANRDGFLTTEELSPRDRAMKVRRMRGADGQPGERRAMRDPNAAFDRLDANRDGSISRDEFARNRIVHIERRVVKNGQRQPGAMHGMKRGGGMMGAAMLRMADTDRDGRVSLAEATSGALRHFDMIDSNRDGRITPEERATGRVHMRQMRRAG